MGIKVSIMFRNYIKIAFRNLWKNKGFSAINILGLSIGITTCLIIMQEKNSTKHQ